jgi:hypothetical protein
MFQTKVSMTRPSKDERREVLPSSSFGNTAEQDAFINAPILGGSFVLVNAVAGSGKTYSIVSRLREKREAAGPSLLLAYNTLAVRQMSDACRKRIPGRKIEVLSLCKYAKVWDDDCRVRRAPLAPGCRVISLDLDKTRAAESLDAIVRERYPMELYRDLIKRLVVARDVLAFSPEHGIAKVVEIFSTASKTFPNPRAVGWSVDALRLQWLGGQLLFGVPEKEWPALWHTYTEEVLKPLFRRAAPEAFVYHGSEVLDADDARPELSNVHLEYMCVMCWMDGEDDIMDCIKRQGGFMPSFRFHRWARMWYEWYNDDDASVRLHMHAHDMTVEQAEDGFFRKWAVVYIDEAQDADKSIVKMCGRHSRGGAQVVFVGDDLQNIYGCFGTVNMFDDKTRQCYFGTTAVQSFALTATFRVPKTSIDYLEGCMPRLVPKAMRAVSLVKKQRPLSAFWLAASDATVAVVQYSFVQHVKMEVAIQRITGDVFVLGKSNSAVADAAARYVVANPDCKALSCSTKLYHMLSDKELDECEDAEHDSQADTDTPAIFREKLIRLHGHEVFSRLVSIATEKRTDGSPFFSTVHSSKGLEAREVILTSDVTPGNTDETENVFYVAVTRAKTTVTFIL